MNTQENFHPHDRAIVEIDAGLLAGSEGDIRVFRGVPYAVPPVGALRWRPPIRVDRWAGLRAATEFGPDPVQAPHESRAPGMSEDCLYLNIWTPARDARASLPVMVWIPGGSFIGGSGADPVCDGANVARKGVVVVTINYRVGLFGFLAHAELSAEDENGTSGNYGLIDQLAALSWVRDNISAFGGNPDRITAFGVSAGAGSISLLLTSTRCRGIFQQAILQSPGSLRPLAGLREAEAAGRVLGNNLNAMRALSAAQVFARTGEFIPRIRGLTTPQTLRPIRDGWFIDQDERIAFASGQFSAMPIIVGSNFDEGSMFVKEWPIKTRNDYEHLLEINFGEYWYEALRYYPVRQNEDLLNQCGWLFGDAQFTYGVRGIARANSAREKTFRYLFSRRCGEQASMPRHGEEVPYVFGNFSARPEMKFNDHARSLSNSMMEAWTRFAATGNPNGDSSVRWPAYAANRDNYLEFGDKVEAGANFRKEQLNFLDRYFAAHPR